MLSATQRLAALSSLLWASLATAATVDHDWSISWLPDHNPDGLFSRSVIGVNGQWPPPILNVNASDVLRVTAHNDLNTGVGASLHSHGMFFNNTNYFDGAVGITQCPIGPGASMTYEILNSNRSSPERRRQYGTYWIHAHNNDQYTDGLKAPLIIHPDTPAEQPYSYDDDFTVILSDWYHSNYTDLVKNEFMNKKNPTGAEPVPKSGLMYFAHTPNTTNQATYFDGFNDNATLPFEAGKTYRLRLINMSALAAFYFYIGGHDMRVIEVEGVDVEPFPIDYLTLAVAQRFSVLVTARNDTEPQNWKIHANMDEDMFDVVPEDLQLNVTSTISYPGAKAGVFGDDKVIEEYEYFDDTQLVPLIAEGMPEPTIETQYDVVFDTYADGENYASMNKLSWVFPKTPSMLTAMSMPATDPAAIYGPNSNALILPHMATVRVTIVNTDAGKHPFHLHGHHFQVIHKSQDITSTDPAINPPFNASQVNPMRRDTVMVPPGGSATFQFIADNPGSWFFHCHIDPHLVSGLASVFIEAPDVMQQRLQLPPGTTERCAAAGLPSSGNAAGLFSTTDFTGLAKGPKELETGWTPRAVGAFTGCIITALVGLASVIIYGWNNDAEEEEEEEDEKRN